MNKLKHKGLCDKHFEVIRHLSVFLLQHKAGELCPSELSFLPSDQPLAGRRGKTLLSSLSVVSPCRSCGSPGFVGLQSSAIESTN